LPKREFIARRVIMVVAKCQSGPNLKRQKMIGKRAATTEPISGMNPKIKISIPLRIGKSTPIIYRKMPETRALDRLIRVLQRM
jgi:hypothetical protein